MTEKYNIDSPESQALLTEMRSLISSEAKWCKGSNARDNQGKPVPILSPNANSWDIMGALVYSKNKLAQPDFGAYQVVYEFLKSNIPETSKNKDIEYYTDLLNWSEFSQFLGITNDIIVNYVRATEDGKVRITENGRVLLVKEHIKKNYKYLRTTESGQVRTTEDGKILLIKEELK